MQKKSPIKKRILQFIDKKGISKYVFYNKSGITRGILDQETGITEDNIAKFLAYAPEIDSRWLLTGEGEMLKGTHKAIVATHGTSIPLIPLDAMAGFSNGTGDQVMHFECDYYNVPDFNGRADFLIRVVGSSMAPKYHNGDIVACTKLALDTFFQWNKVYVLDTKQGPLVKRVKKTNNPGHILLVSDNPQYEPFEVPLKEIHALAIVMGVIRLE